MDSWVQRGSHPKHTCQPSHHICLHISALDSCRNVCPPPYYGTADHFHFFVLMEGLELMRDVSEIKNRICIPSKIYIHLRFQWPVQSLQPLHCHPQVRKRYLMASGLCAGTPSGVCRPLPPEPVDIHTMLKVKWKYQHCCHFTTNNSIATAHCFRLYTCVKKLMTVCRFLVSMLSWSQSLKVFFWHSSVWMYRHVRDFGRGLNVPFPAEAVILLLSSSVIVCCVVLYI